LKTPDITYNLHYDYVRNTTSLGIKYKPRENLNRYKLNDRPFMSMTATRHDLAFLM